MEHLQGETLASRLAKGGLPVEPALRYAIDICEGLDKAHHGGVVHRDLKPANIMLTKSGAKLMDFGLAKAAPPLGVPGKTVSLASPSHPAWWATANTMSRCWLWLASTTYTSRSAPSERARWRTAARSVAW